MRVFAVLALGTPLFLSACSGSGSNQPRPVMAAGFADSQTDYSAPYTFREDTVAVTRVANDDSVSADEIAITMQGTPGIGPIDVTVDGETYTLQRDPVTNDRFVDTGDITLLNRPIFNESNTEASYLAILDDDAFTSGYFVFGYDSSPNDVARRVGRATYEGGAALTLRGENRRSFGLGSSVVTVDFDADTIRGDIEINDSQSSGANFNIPDIFFTLNATEIDQNGFAGTTSARSNVNAETFRNGTYFGRFYEDNATTVGGQFAGEVDIDVFNDTLQYEGVFIATD